MTNDPDIVGRADKWIIPGVGNFKATAPLANGKLGDLLRGGFSPDGRPLLGICLGLQWMFEGSSEAPELRGLSAFTGECTRFSDRVKSPHVGWDSIAIDGRSRLLAGIPSGAYVYFTHSYRAPLCGDTVATCAIRRTRSPQRRSGEIYLACNFIPRSRAMWACRSWRTSVRL